MLCYMKQNLRNKKIKQRKTAFYSLYRINMMNFYFSYPISHKTHYRLTLKLLFRTINNVTISLDNVSCVPVRFVHPIKRIGYTN
jgi:hypothetical protein